MHVLHVAMAFSSSYRGNECATHDLDLNHPPSSYEFPKHMFTKKNIAYRSCHAEWFKSWSWLHYDEDKDAVSCSLCLKTVREERLKSGNAEQAFGS